MKYSLFGFEWASERERENISCKIAVINYYVIHIYDYIMLSVVVFMKIFFLLSFLLLSFMWSKKKIIKIKKNDFMILRYNLTTEGEINTLIPEKWFSLNALMHKKLLLMHINLLNFNHTRMQ